MSLSVYIVEDDVSACKRFEQAAENIDNINIVGNTNDASVALDFIKIHKPEAVILDLELHMGSGNGLDLLKKINSFQAEKPYVIVTTNNSNRITYDYAQKNGAGFIMSKHQNNYSEWEVLNFLNMISSSIIDARSCSVPAFSENPDDIKGILMSDILQDLNKIGIKPSVSGYKYLSTAIYHTAVDDLSTMLDELSRMYKKTPSSIEHAMRNAINSAWTRIAPQTLYDNYKGNFREGQIAPTTTQFICYYAEKLKCRHHRLFENFDGKSNF